MRALFLSWLKYYLKWLKVKKFISRSSQDPEGHGHLAEEVFQITRHILGLDCYCFSPVYLRPTWRGGRSTNSQSIPKEEEDSEDTDWSPWKEKGSTVSSQQWRIILPSGLPVTTWKIKQKRQMRRVSQDSSHLQEETCLLSCPKTQSLLKYLI